MKSLCSFIQGKNAQTYTPLHRMYSMYVWNRFCSDLFASATSLSQLALYPVLYLLAATQVVSNGWEPGSRLVHAEHENYYMSCVPVQVVQEVCERRVSTKDE